MASEPETTEQDDRLQEIKARLDDFEAELEGEIEKGKGTIADLTDDIRTRIQELRDGEQEPSQTNLEQLEGKLDELSTEIKEEFDEGTKTATSILDDLKRRVKELEQKIRGD